MKNKVSATVKILTLLNGIGVLVLLVLMWSRETIISDITWVCVTYLTLGVVGIVMGISIKISDTEVPQDINVRSYRKGNKTIGSALLIYSLFIVIISILYFFT